MLKLEIVSENKLVSINHLILFTSCNPDFCIDEVIPFGAIFTVSIVLPLLKGISTFVFFLSSILSVVGSFSIYSAGCDDNSISSRHFKIRCFLPSAPVCIL